MMAGFPVNASPVNLPAEIRRHHAGGRNETSEKPADRSRLRPGPSGSMLRLPDPCERKSRAKKWKKCRR